MATVVLVHGGNMSTDTWNRLRGRNDYPPGGQLGPKYWNGTVAYLEAHGHRAFAPALPDEHTHDLSDHIGVVCRLMEDHDLRGVVLVGHSYGGMVITGAAERIRARVRKLVYVDAALPDPGQSLFDLFSASGADPLSFAGLEAACAYTQKLQYDPGRLRGIGRVYIRCTESDFAGVTRAAQAKIAEGGAGQWDYRELPTSHVPMATMPERFHRMLLNAALR